MEAAIARLFEALCCTFGAATAERPFGSVAALWQIFGIDEEGKDEDAYEDQDTGRENR